MPAGTEMPNPVGRRLFIKTFGCQMNVYDSERMADLLAPLGYGLSEEAEGADIVILNTCHIREKAAEKLFSDLGRLRPFKAAHGTVIAVAGCVAQAQGQEILRRAPHVDLVLGPQSYHRLPELIARIHRERRRILATDFNPEPKFDALPLPGARGPAAFLTIQEGCDKFCTFCVVPYTRGAEYSRPAAAVLVEARALAAQGVREITLLGQNVNAYAGPGDDGPWNLARLIRALSDIKGIERLRYTTSHPRDMDAALIAAHRDIPQLMPFLHLPVQSGSDRVLAAMNRGHAADEYLRLVDRIRTARPDMAFSSDFIVGFPGETERDFEDTVSLVEKVGFAQAYSFRYSARPGTPAAALPEASNENALTLAGERLQALQAVLRKQQQSFNAASIGQRLRVLLEKPGRNPGQLVGRSPYLQGVHLHAPADLQGQVVEADITDASVNSLTGVLAGSALQGQAA